MRMPISQDYGDKGMTKTQSVWSLKRDICSYLVAVHYYVLSKLQMEIALSTTEAEYIALSQSMLDLLPMKVTKIEEVQSTLGIDMEQVMMHSTTFKDNNGALTFATAKKVTPR